MTRLSRSALRALLLTAMALIAMAALFASHRDALPVAPKLTQADPAREPARHAQQARAAEIDARFQEAVIMLHAKQYEHAVTALHRLLELAPGLPEAHVNMGFAMLGLKRAQVARDFFASAIELRTQQANAYYGLAMAQELLGDLPGALGAMRTFTHLARADNPYLPKARSAIWEWEEASKPHRRSHALEARLEE